MNIVFMVKTMRMRIRNRMKSIFSCIVWLRKKDKGGVRKLKDKHVLCLENY